MNGVARIPEPREWLLENRCTLCHQVKPWALFSPQRYFNDGTVRQVASRCKECSVEVTAARAPDYRARNADRLRTYQREWKRNRTVELALDRDARLDPAPFVAWLLEQKLAAGSWAEVAALCGVEDYALRRCLTQRTVRRSLVDACLTARGEHLDDLYPVSA